MNDESKMIVERFYVKFAGFSFTQEEADAIKSYVQRCVHPGMIRFPRFKSEAEEKKWWDNNPDIILKQFETAAKNGTLGRGTLKKRVKKVQYPCPLVTI